MSTQLAEAVRGARQLRDSGAGTDAVVRFLRDAGLTITESMEAMMAAYGMSLSQAKATVTASPVWSVEVRAADQLHEELIKMLADT